MSEQGWIKLHRQIKYSDVYQMPPLYLRVFERLIIEANHQDNEIPYKSGKKLIKRGERLTSLRQICQWVGWYERGIFKTPNPKTVKAILDWLQQNGMIEIYGDEGNRKETHYKIVNYDIYQSDDDIKVTEKKQLGNSKETEKKQSMDINKNDKECTKNEKNDKKYINKDNTITPAKSATPPLADSENLLSRYTPEQQEIITRYWDTIRFTRKNAKIADSIKLREMEYWARFPVDIVIEAIKIHLSRYQTKPEEYTRGIMRRLAREREMGYAPAKPVPENDDNSVYDNLW